eukprot:Seg1855.8 transcript_id=Seg1855.8/GoldUCD/mRNA.D3Y31 product="Early endosome antigen 1" protein_id=Seg1855.8/GoldUCD/D3Y31
MSEQSLNDSREAIEILSEKDQKIAGLKRQLDELKSKNLGLENCVKNQDSAVRKIGSLVVSPRSTESSEVVSTTAMEDVIDDVYRKIRRMEHIDSELKGFAQGLRKGGKICVSGEIELKRGDGVPKEGRRTNEGFEKGVDKSVGDDRSTYDKSRGTDCRGRERDDRGRTTNKDDALRGKLKKAENQIFASERAFRQISRDKPINEKILNLRLDQLRNERDELYDILKQYEPVIAKISELERDDEEGKAGRNRSNNLSRVEIDASITIEDNTLKDTEKQELLYHIDELKKCLEDIKKQKSKKKRKGEKENGSVVKPVDYEALKAHIDELEAKSDTMESQRSIERPMIDQQSYGLQDSDEVYRPRKEEGSQRHGLSGTAKEHPSLVGTALKDGRDSLHGTRPERPERVSSWERGYPSNPKANNYLDGKETKSSQDEEMKEKARQWIAMNDGLDQRSSDRENKTKEMSGRGRRKFSRERPERWEAEKARSKEDSNFRPRDRYYEEGNKTGANTAPQESYLNTKYNAQGFLEPNSDGDDISRRRKDHRSDIKEAGIDNTSEVAPKYGGKHTDYSTDEYETRKIPTYDARSYTAEKPGVLLDRNENEGNQVTKVLSHRIQELEKQEARNKTIIETLTEKLDLAMKDNRMAENEKGRLVKKVNDLVEATMPREDSGNEMLRKLHDKGDVAKTDDLLEMVEQLEEHIRLMNEERVKLEIVVTEMENKQWMTTKLLEKEIGEKGDLEKEIRELEMRDTEKGNRNKELEIEAEFSKANMKELKEKIEKAGAEMDDLNKREVKLGRRLEDETDKVKKLEENLKSTQETLSNEQENSRLFKHMLQETEQAKEKLNYDLNILRDDIASLSTQNSELQYKVDEERKGSQKVSQEKERFEQEVVSLKMNNDMISKDLKSAKEELGKQKRELVEAQKLKPILDEVMKRNEGLSKSEARLEKDIMELQNKIDGSLKEMGGLQEKLKAKDKELVEANKMKAIIDELKKQNMKLGENEVKLKQEISDLSTEIDRCQENLKDLQKKLSARNEEFIEGQREIGAEREKLHKARKEIGEKDEEIRKFKRDLNDKNNQNDKMKFENDELKEKKDFVERQLGETTETLTELESKLKALESLNGDLKAGNKDLSDRLHFEEVQVSELQEALKVSMIETEELQEKVKLYKDKISEKEVMISKKEERCAEKERLIEEKDDQIEMLEEQINDQKEQNTELKGLLQSSNDESVKARKNNSLLDGKYQATVKEFAGLQKALENSWAEKEGIEKQLHDKASEIERLSGELEEKIKDIKLKDEAIKRLIRDDEKKGEQICEMFETITNLKDTVMRKEEEIENMRMDVLEQKQGDSQKEVQLESCRAENEKLAEDVLQKEDKILKLRKELSNENERCSQLAKDLKEKTNEVGDLNTRIGLLMSKHKLEVAEHVGKWELFEEYNYSLKEQLGNYKRREEKMRENGQRMKIEVNKISDELSKAKLIVRDFQSALLDKDSDLKKIHDAVMLLERSYAAKESEAQNRIADIQEELEIVTKENKELGTELLEQERYADELKMENKELLARIRKDEDIILRMGNENNYLNEDLMKLKGALKLGNEKLGRRENEVSSLKNKLVDDGREVEGLIGELEKTLGNVREQLGDVEREKMFLKQVIEDDESTIQKLEERMKELKHDLKQKDEDLLLERARKDDLQRKVENKTKEKADLKKIEDLKNDLFKLGREKQAVVLKLTKERDEALLQKTAEKMAKENVKLQCKNLREELEKVKVKKEGRGKEFDRYVDELKRLLAEGREREKELVAKEGDYKLKLQEMSGTVRKLESRIDEAVMNAEDEKKQREDILAQLLSPLEAVEKKTGVPWLRGREVGSEKWKQRANNLQVDIEDLQKQFSKYKNKGMAEKDAIFERLENAKSEHLMNLRKELDEAQKEKIEVKKKLNDLSYQLDSLRNTKEKIVKENNKLNEELRLAKQEALIQKHELDWLRSSVGKYGMGTTG